MGHQNNGAPTLFHPWFNPQVPISQQNFHFGLIWLTCLPLGQLAVLLRTGTEEDATLEEEEKNICQVNPGNVQYRKLCFLSWFSISTFLTVKEKNYSWHMIKKVGKILLKGWYYNGILWHGREIWLNSEYSKDKWRFTAKKQSGRGQWMENY